MKLTHCNVCKECWFDTSINNNGKCKHCMHFSFTNDMDPFPGTGTYPFHLPKLSIVEEMLIAKAHVIMSVYRLKKSGTVVYRGNVLNIEQDNNALLKSILNCNDTLPRKFRIYLFSTLEKIVAKTLWILRILKLNVVI